MLPAKIKKHISAERILASIGLGVLIALAFAGPLHGQTVTQGYGSDTVLQRGTVVSLVEGDATKIEPATNDNAARLLGVTVAPNDAPVTLSGDGQTAFVATIGRYDVLVSNQNGTIGAGDYLAISSVGGIAAKADASHRMIVGRAVGVFNGTDDSLGTTVIRGEGSERTVALGRIQVDIGVGSNPLFRGDQNSIPSILRSISEAVSDKPVSATRAYIAVIVFAVTATVAGAMLYAGIRSSITAIGRNPLSKKSIVRGLVQVTLTSLIIFISGTFGVYLLLKL